MDYDKHNHTITRLPQTASSQLFDPHKYTTDKTGHIRFDFLFSDWMTIWFLLYWFLPKTKRSVSPITHAAYEWMNPLLVYFLGFGENIFTFALLVYYCKSPTILLKFATMILISKFLPIVLLWNRPFHAFFNFILGILVFLIYNLYLVWNETNIVDIYSRTFTSLLEDKNLTPLYTFANTAIAFFSGKSPNTIPDFTRLSA
jgi:hypothetical protein